MNQYDDLDEYNGDPVHDMYVDADYEINTGELPYVFDDDSLDDFVDELDDWD